MSDPTVSEGTLRREAESIFEDVSDARLELPDGGSGWVGYLSARGTPVVKTREGLYSGHTGLAVYFAAMDAVVGGETYRRHVEEALEFLFEEPAAEIVRETQLGAGSGVGSLVYGLSLVSELLGDDRYRNRARELIDALSAEQITNDGRYDVQLGAAGAVHGLLAHHERTGDEVARDRAVRCGDHLLDECDDKWGRYQVWDTSQSSVVKSFSTGMSHGAAGVAYALYRLYDHTGREAFRRTADSTIGFENLFYSGYEKNWKANWSGIRNYSSWWCYGRVGIGTARLGSLQYHDSETLRRDLQRASEGLDAEPSQDDSICHGTFGQVDFLLELGRTVDEQYAGQARRLAAAAIQRRREEGRYRVTYGDVDGIDNPILFPGLAGIGYTILRLLRPEKIPSLLRFE